uniref:Uncharacterized protein n=1 Tax=viral metagenome TaxID=1070528 RepID=A0A6H1ZYY8_9ZZZZ
MDKSGDVPELTSIFCYFDGWCMLAEMSGCSGVGCEKYVPDPAVEATRRATLLKQVEIMNGIQR